MDEKPVRSAKVLANERIAKMHTGLCYDNPVMVDDDSVDDIPATQPDTPTAPEEPDEMEEELRKGVKWNPYPVGASLTSEAKKAMIEEFGLEYYRKFKHGLKHGSDLPGEEDKDKTPKQPINKWLLSEEEAKPVTPCQPNWRATCFQPVHNNSPIRDNQVISFSNGSISEINLWFFL